MTYIRVIMTKTVIAYTRDNRSETDDDIVKKM